MALLEVTTKPVSEASTGTRRQGSVVAPSVLVVLLGVVIAFGVVGGAFFLRLGALGTLLESTWKTTTGPVLIGFLLVVMALEVWRPAVRRPTLGRSLLVNGCYVALFALVIVPILGVVREGIGLEFARHARFLILTRLPLLPQAFTVVGILVLMDGVNWLAHVANHRSRTLWRLHALHHSEEDMNVLSTFRTHPLIHAVYLTSMLPGLVLLANGHAPALAFVVYGCLIALPHANLAWTFGPLGKVFVSPAFHRLHHNREAADAAVNFGFVFSIWDRLAATAVDPHPASTPCPTGLAQRPVPVEQQLEADVHLESALRLLCRHLAQPFRRTPFVEGGLS